MAPIPIAPPPSPISNWTEDERKTDKAVNSPDACPECSGNGYFRQEVPVGHPEFGKLIRCDCRVQKQHQARRQQSQLEGWLTQATFQNYVTNHSGQAALQAAREFAQNPCGWLTLWGNFGNGKTHLSAAVVNDCVARSISAIYYTMPDLLDLIKDSFKVGDYSPQFEFLRTVPVLVLDEVDDKVNWTGWAKEKFFQLAEARYRRVDELGTLFTMNREPNVALAEADGSFMGYVFSRMRDQRSRVIHLAAPDARSMAKTLWASQIVTKE